LRKVQLAERIGLTAAAISQFEHGTNRPSPATLGKLALTLGVSVDFFEQRPGPPVVAAPQGAFFRSLDTQHRRSSACEPRHARCSSASSHVPSRLTCNSRRCGCHRFRSARTTSHFRPTMPLRRHALSSASHLALCRTLFAC
jgi:DNA-binding XRE family transcriptional regulator